MNSREPNPRTSPSGIDDPFVPLLDRATHKLRGDSDLQLEIAQELRGHLQDSAAEFRAAGLDEAQADAKAIEVMGDPDALAGQLWQANRRRLRRRAIVNSAFWLTVGPAAAVICGVVLWNVATTVAVLAALVGVDGSLRSRFFNYVDFDTLARDAWTRTTAPLSAEDRLLLGLPAPYPDSRVAVQIANARQLLAQWPNDPVVYANYVGQWLATLPLDSFVPLSGQVKDREETQREGQKLIEALDRGAILEPDNGYYPLLKAVVLLNTSCRTVSEPVDKMPGFDAPLPGNKDHRALFSRIVVTDRAAFDRGLLSLHDAASKPRIESYAWDLAQRRLQRLSPAKSLSEYLMRSGYSITTIFPAFYYERAALDPVAGYVINEAAGQRSPQLAQVLDDERRVALLTLAASHLPAEVLLSRGLAHEAEEQRGMYHLLRGETAAFDQSKQRLADETLATDHSSARERAAQLLDQAAYFQKNTRIYGAELRQMDPSPGRRAEYAVADQGAVAGLVVLLLLAAGARVLLLGGAAIVRRIRATDETPVIDPFIGWHRVGAVAFLGGMLPIVAFLAYAWLTPLGGRGRGVEFTWPRLVLEYTTLAAVIGVLVRVLTRRALSRRTAALQLKSETPRFGPWRRHVGVILLVAVGSWLILWIWFTDRPDAWHHGDFQPMALLLGTWLLALIITVCVMVYGPMVMGFGTHRVGNGSAVATIKNAPTMFWTRPYRFPLILPLFLVCVVGLFAFSRPAIRSYPNYELFFPAASFASGLAALLLLGWRLIAERGNTTAAGPTARSIGQGRNVSWRSGAKSLAITYAATAFVAGGLGIGLLHWQERHAVEQFNHAGYGFLDELENSSLRAIHDGARRELSAFNRSVSATSSPAD